MSAKDSRAVGRLCSLTRECADCDSEEAVGGAAVDAALDLFDADAGIAATIEDGWLVPLAARAPVLYDGEFRPAGDGLAGETRRAGEPLVIDDTRESGVADPTHDRFRSVLSAPLGDGVLQAFAEREGAFAAVNLTVAEHICAVAEQALDRVRTERVEARERDLLGALFDNLSDPAVRCSRGVGGEPIVESVNSAFVEVFGYDPAAVSGESLVDAVVPADASNPPELRPEGARTTTEEAVERETATGTREFLLQQVSVTQNADRGYVIYTDVEPLKRRERELQRQNERLDRFADVVSHDLRNPMNVAQGYLTTVEGRPGDEEALASVEDALERMNDIVEDTLAMARQGQPVEDPDSVSVGAVAERAWRGVVTDNAAFAVRDDEVVAADESRLQQLLENLFRNSVEHAGEVTVEVGSLAAEPGFYVADDGPGIPPADRDRVLERGETGGDDDGGTGLGLAVVAEIADAHGWRVRVTDHETGGARFEFATGGRAVRDVEGVR